MFETIQYSEVDGVAEIVFDRQDKLNSIDQRMLSELTRCLADIEQDDRVRVAIFTGRGKAFSAGADIGDALKARTAEETYRFSRTYQGLCQKVAHLSIPTIAAVNGIALGGGCELALACDFILAAEGAQFGLPEVKLGGFPAAGGTQRLPRLIGAPRAKEVLMFGSTLAAEELHAMNLVNRVMPKDELLQEARAWAAKLCEMPRLALSAIKVLVNQGPQMGIEDSLEFESRMFSSLSSSFDYVEGKQAFMEKRPPKFQGR